MYHGFYFYNNPLVARYNIVQILDNILIEHNRYAEIKSY